MLSMKKQKVFATLAVVAMTVATVFSSGGIVAKADEANVTDKPLISTEFIGEGEVKALDDKDAEVIREDAGYTIGGEDLKVYFFSADPSEEAKIKINWDVDSIITKDNVVQIQIKAFIYKRDSSGNLQKYAIWTDGNPYFNDSGEAPDEIDLSSYREAADKEVYDGATYGCWSVRFLSDEGWCDCLFAFEGMDTFNYKDNASSDNDNDNTDAEDYVLDLSESNTPISSEDFANLLSENATKDVVIKSNNDVTFTFAKGSMSAVDGKDSYDFSTSIVKKYSDSMPGYVTEDSFVRQINYNYSGKLPAEASIRFKVGKQYAEKTLYYYLMNEDNTYTVVQTVVVDAEGYVTVKQDHCSSYILTKEELKTENSTEDNKETESTNTENNTETEPTNTENNTETEPASTDNGTTNNNTENKAPDTGDTVPACVYVAIIAVAFVAIMTAKRKSTV